MSEQNYFEQLNAVNCNDKIEKKGKLSYLSWAWAWSEVKKRFPDATYTIYENKDGLFYHTDGRTCWVKTGVTVNGIEHIEYLPVMDNRNKSIALNSVTSFDVNTSIQRSLTKACARHGLGLYIYAGEDLPEDESNWHREPVNKPKEEKPVDTRIEAAHEKAKDVKRALFELVGKDKEVASVLWRDMYEKDKDDVVKMNSALIEIQEKLKRVNNLDA